MADRSFSNARPAARPAAFTWSGMAVAPVLAVVVAGFGCATSGLPDEPIMKKYEPTQWVSNMKSGLKVIVKEDRSAPQVAIVSVFGSGSKADPKGLEGIAHLVEHLAFRTRPGGGMQYWDHLKRLGGNFNAFTSHDVTAYYTVAHKDNLAHMMQLEAWRLSRTMDGVTEEVFKPEREVVRNELRESSETNFGGRMFDLMFETIFPNTHPMNRAVIGTHESLTAIKFQDVKDFVKANYTPDNTTVVIAGDFNTDDVKKMLGMWPPELLFGPGGPDGSPVPPKARLGERPAPEVPTVKVSELKKEKGPIDENLLVLTWTMPPGYRGDDALMEFAADRLNLAMGEALEVDDDDDIRNAGASAEIFADSSVMLMFASLKPGADPQRARERLLDTLSTAWTTDLGRVQTEQTRWFGATDLLLSIGDPVDSALSLAVYAAATGKHTYYSEQFEEIAKLKAGQVTDFAAKWLTRERAAAFFFEPDSSDIPRVVGGGGGGGGASSAPSGRNEHTMIKDLVTSAEDYGPEKIKQTVRSPQLASVRKETLSNGLEMFVLANPGAPIARLQLRLRGGITTTKPVGAATIASRFSRSRCKDHGSLAPVGGRLSSNVNLASSDVTTTVLSGNIANGIAVLSDEVRCREADEEIFLQLPRWLEQQRKSFEIREKRPEFVAGKRVGQALYPGHSFAEAEFYNPADLKSVRREDAQAFVQGHYRPDNGALVVFGDIDPEDVKKESNKYLTAWTQGGGGSSMDPPPAPSGPSAREVVLIDRPKATQASIIIGCRLINLTPELLAPFDVLQQLASEKAWAVREQWGATYGIRPFISRMPGGAADMTITGAIENAQVGKSITRILGIVSELASGNIEPKLFATKRWDAGLAFMNRFATPMAKANALLDLSIRRWPIDSYDKYPERLAGTTPASLKEIMAPCVGKEVLAIVGDSASIKPQLEKEGLKLATK